MNRKETQALDAYLKLMRAAESTTARIHRHLSEAGLTMSQFGVLEALHHIGPLCQKDIGQKLLRSSGNITMVIDNLEKRGLVRRERNPKDRRFFVVHLAEEGRQIIGDLFPRHTKVIAGEMSALTEDEQKTLATLCKKLGLKNKNE